MAQIKILKTCSVMGEEFEKDQLIEIPDYPGPRKQMLQQLAEMGFAKAVSEGTKPKDEAK